MKCAASWSQPHKSFRLEEKSESIESPTSLSRCKVTFLEERKLLFPPDCCKICNFSIFCAFLHCFSPRACCKHEVCDRGTCATLTPGTSAELSQLSSAKSNISWVLCGAVQALSSVQRSGHVSAGTLPTGLVLPASQIYTREQLAHSRTMWGKVEDETWNLPRLQPDLSPLF